MYTQLLDASTSHAPSYPFRSSSLQETPFRPRQDLVIVWLKRQPTFARSADLLVAEPRLVLWDERLLVSAALLGRVDEELGVAWEGVSEGSE